MPPCEREKKKREKDKAESSRESSKGRSDGELLAVVLMGWRGISVLAERAPVGERGVAAPRGRAGENRKRASFDART
jgi:hypothetical protein